jgi:hypothetical protein
MAMEERERLWSIEDAPVDDEPLTADDEQALAEAERDLAEGRVVSHAEARRRLLLELPSETSDAWRIELRERNWRP